MYYHQAVRQLSPLKLPVANPKQQINGSGNVLEESRILIERTNRMLECLANIEAKEVKADMP